MINFDWSLVPGSILCTVHLMLGLVVGYGACYFVKPLPQPQSAGGSEVRQFKAAIDGLLTQVQQLSALSKSQSSALPAIYIEAIAKLIESVSSVQSQMNSHIDTQGKLVRNSPPVTRTDRAESARPIANGAKPVSFADDAEASPFHGLTAPLYDELTKAAAAIESDVDSRDVRRPYRVLQYMAPWNGELPRPIAYQEVACNDLSEGGISFFTKELPVSKLLVITLGPEHDLLMQAEILHYQRRKEANSYVFFVGCRFTQRIENVPEEYKPVRFEIVG